MIRVTTRATRHQMSGDVGDSWSETIIHTCSANLALGLGCRGQSTEPLSPFIAQDGYTENHRSHSGIPLDLAV